MTREYRYVGSRTILDKLPASSSRVCVHSASDVLTWINQTRQPVERDGTVIATFIIDTDHQLWINDRRSEHVLCAAGQNVLSAGEMTFATHKQNVEVIEVTNQSTGYCPEPASWSAVASALDAAHLAHPGDFTIAYLFRRCDSCETTNIVKDMWFECGVCGSPLSQQWNYDGAD